MEDYGLEAKTYMAEPALAAAPKVKRPMTNTEKERNERRKAAFAELKALNPKVKWTNASKLTSFRNKGNTEGERAFMEAILVPAEAAGNAAAATAVAANKNVPAAVNAAQNAVLNEAGEVANKVANKYSRNNVKASLMRVMSKYNLKPSGAVIQQLLGLRRKGLNNTQFLAELNAKTAATAAKRAAKTLKKNNKAKNVLTQKTWKNIKQQVDMNVAASGLKVNALNRRALGVSRKNRPNLTVANFMRNRAPRKRKTKKNFQRNTYNVQKAKNKAMQNYYNQKKGQREREVFNFAPEGNMNRLENFLK